MTDREHAYAFDMGYSAYEYGDARCPFRESDPRAGAWWDGYDDAASAAEERYLIAESDRGYCQDPNRGTVGGPRSAW